MMWRNTKFSSHVADGRHVWMSTTTCASASGWTLLLTQLYGDNDRGCRAKGGTNLVGIVLELNTSTSVWPRTTLTQAWQRLQQSTRGVSSLTRVLVWEDAKGFEEVSRPQHMCVQSRPHKFVQRHMATDTYRKAHAVDGDDGPDEHNITLPSNVP